MIFGIKTQTDTSPQEVAPTQAAAAVPAPAVQVTVQDQGAGQPPKVVQTQQIGKYQVQVIREKCIGAASCVAIAPHTFDLDEENIAIILSQSSEDDDDTKLLAAQSCPTAAIIVIDTETGQQVWPR